MTPDERAGIDETTTKKISYGSIYALSLGLSNAKHRLYIKQGDDCIAINVEDIDDLIYEFQRYKKIL